MVVRKQNDRDNLGTKSKEAIGYLAALGASLTMIAIDAARGVSPFSAAAGGAALLSGYELFLLLRDKRKKSFFGGRWRDSGSNWEG